MAHHPDTLTATRGPHASLLRLSLALLAAVVFPATVLFVRPSFFSNVAAAMNLTPFVGALAYLIASAAAEEATKAAAIGVADLRRSRFSWFGVTVAAAGIMGLVEVGLRALYFQGSLGILALSGVRTMLAHIALSLICVALARSFNNWIVAVGVAGLLHALVNYGRVVSGVSLIYLITTGVLFVAVIAAAFVWRSRFDWRAQDHHRLVTAAPSAC